MDLITIEQRSDIISDLQSLTNYVDKGPRQQCLDESHEIIFTTSSVESSRHLERSLAALLLQFPWW